MSPGAKQALGILERALKRPLTNDECRSFAYGYGLGVQSDTIGMARLDDGWPTKNAKNAAAATWGVWAGEAERVASPFDVSFAIIDAANLPVPAETPLGDFDHLRPRRISGQDLRPWWFDFSTGDDGMGYYGWHTYEGLGQGLSVSDVIDRLGLKRAPEIIRYSGQALAAVPALKRARLTGPGGSRVALKVLSLGQAKLESELLTAATLIPTARPGNLSRPSSLSAG